MNDQFEAMVATTPEPESAECPRCQKIVYGVIYCEHCGWVDAPKIRASLKGVDDLYCGHKDPQGLSWTRKHCPICLPKDKVQALSEAADVFASMRIKDIEKGITLGLYYDLVAAYMAGWSYAKHVP